MSDFQVSLPAVLHIGLSKNVAFVITSQSSCWSNDAPNSVDLNRMSTGNALSLRLLGLGGILEFRDATFYQRKLAIPSCLDALLCNGRNVWSDPSFQFLSKKTGQHFPRRFLHFSCTPLPGWWGAETWVILLALSLLISAAVPDEVLSGGWKPGALALSAAWPGQTKASEHPHRPLRSGRSCGQRSALSRIQLSV